MLLLAAFLITISFVIDKYWADNFSISVAKKNIGDYIHEQENDFEKVVADSGTVNSLLSKKYTEQLVKQFIGKKYFFFIYKQKNINNDSLVFWNTQIVQPGNFLLALRGNSGFLELSNGQYVWRKAKIGGSVFIALIPVKWNYSITNEYLQNTFVIDKQLGAKYKITSIENEGAIISKNGNFLFSLNLQSGNTINHNTTLSIIFRILGVLVLLLFIHLLAAYIVKRKFYNAVVFLVSVVIVLRLLSYLIPIPLSFRQFELFDPSIYGYNIIFPSLGDLLINSVLILWVVLFVRYYIQTKNIFLKMRQPALRAAFTFTGVLLLLFGTLTVGNIFRSLISDSQIPFDVVNFFTLNVYTIIGFVAFGCIAIGYFFSTQIIIYLLQPIFSRYKVVLPLMVIVLGGIVLFFRIADQNILFELSLAIWLMIYLFLSNTNYLSLKASKIVSSYLIIWLFFFSLSITAIIVVGNNEKEIEKRKYFAEMLAAKADPSNEKMIDIVMTDFRNGTIAPLFNKFKIVDSNKLIKDSLLNKNFTGYLNKYDTRLYTFDEAGNSLYNQDSIAFTTLNAIFKIKSTTANGLHYYDMGDGKFAYISKEEIKSTTNHVLGYVFVIASPKQFNPDALYPELFLEGYNDAIENSSIYSYAVYDKLKLLDSHNDYAFPTRLDALQVPATEFSSRKNNEYDELWYNPGNSKIVIITKEDKLFIESITLFSYIFCSFLFVTAVCWFLNALIRSKLRWSKLKKYGQLSIRTQVHGAIIAINLISFIVIGAGTILFFINRYNANNRDQLSRIIHVMKNELSTSLNDRSVVDSVVQLHNYGYNEKVEKSIGKIAEMHDADLNLYDLEGNLKASSLPLPYNKGILSMKMDPLAYYHLNKQKEIQFFKEEEIGSFKYLGNYVPIVNRAGKEYAYLNIPYFTSRTKLRQEISNFLLAIINLNAFIFLIAGIVVLFITNRITRSFTLISDRMRAVNLGEKNEVIVWSRNDEIGQLVKEYNKMVAKLDKSAASLARNEREGAWREMARQVAHEIKNPLTPMKLSLQYLQRSIANDADNVKELTTSVAKTIVEQIDHLNNIADDFSQFANISRGKNEVFNLNEVLKMVIQLYT
ncbi:MAG: hypothetical protein HY305_07365, partial [Sphingobacteriales bacterium]|nr:hypothetical protein [Sphingobacteriales bacterium]